MSDAALSILPPNATAIERALDVEEQRVLEIPAPLRRLWNPDQALLDTELSALAWSVSTDVWRREWLESRKRRVVANAIADHRIKGTLDGIRQYLRYMDAEVIQVERPPARIFARPYNEERRLQFLARFRQLRIFRLRKREAGGDACTFPGRLVQFGFAKASTAERRYGRRAEVYDPATQQSTEIRWTGSLHSRAANSIDRLVIPARAGRTEAIIGHCYTGRTLASATPARSRMVTLGINTDWANADTASAISALYQPLNVLQLQPRQVTERSPAQGDDAQPGRRIGHMVARNNDAERRVYEVFHLLETDRAPSQTTTGLGPFVGARVSMPAYTARLRINQPSRETGRPMRAGKLLGGFARPARDAFGPLAETLQAASALRDRILFTTQCHRRPRFADRIPLTGPGIPFNALLPIRSAA